MECISLNQNVHRNNSAVNLVAALTAPRDATSSSTVRILQMRRTVLVRLNSSRIAICPLISIVNATLCVNQLYFWGSDVQFSSSLAHQIIIMTNHYLNKQLLHLRWMLLVKTDHHKLAATVSCLLVRSTGQSPSV